MAMLPFCGYHMGDYFAHWLSIGQRLTRPPAIFHVNWFRTGADGRLLWPGYGENLRVLLWALERAAGGGEAVEAALGFLPAPGALRLDGLALAPGSMDALLEVDRAVWLAEAEDIGRFFERFGDRLPATLEKERRSLIQRLGLEGAAT